MKKCFSLAVYLFIIGLFLTSCTPFSVENELTRYSLKLIRVEQPDEEIASNESIYANLGINTLLPTESSFIHLYKDGVVSSLSTIKYSTGKWSYANKDSILTITETANTTVQKTVLKLVSVKNSNFKFKVLSINKIKPSENYFLIYTQSTHYQEGAKDLLSVKENSWRFKPSKKENNEQIKQRVIAQLKYHIDYFDLTKSKEQSYFETKILQSPFNFYQHALGVPENYQLSQEWVKTFYDHQDAEKAANILRKSIDGVDKLNDHERFTDTYKEIITKMIDQLAI
ncbi:hypothetical protein [Solitalea canadensis]|uniref:Lipoprotein n=1 Tax=Solitalea canadensis (strain ATCC 29591 / DSM 3403 / JCM 21819 / LMG 8368 / NBRC 15130 / NCIMB 12057 / USAM 9D) TaxID=929556 RepID=H8KPA6_SOLCM|nr:hypothetical protein [Solitalea canadensis]AFD05804.1 hypothetical protein Solca_0679 [Solitalea canadensis DSM 3403]